MQARIESPAQTVPGAMAALQRLGRAVHETGVPETTLKLVELRASQINGCAVCVDMHARELRNLGESDARIFTVAAWREAPYFTDAERAALALTDAAFQPNPRGDERISDELFAQAAKHYDDKALSTLMVVIASAGFWMNVAILLKPPVAQNA